MITFEEVERVSRAILADEIELARTLTREMGALEMFERIVRKRSRKSLITAMAYATCLLEIEARKHNHSGLRRVVMAVSAVERATKGITDVMALQLLNFLHKFYQEEPVPRAQLGMFRAVLTSPLIVRNIDKVSRDNYGELFGSLRKRNSKG
ncbi:MAG: hypothetical protein ACR2HJ_05535 [Fimbriimonadales bacterium]